MRKLLPVQIAGLLTLIFCYSCSYNSVEELEREAFPNPCDTITASFARDIQPILTRYCANDSFNQNGICHGAGSPIADYTSYTGVKDKVDAGVFRQRAIVERTMPASFSVGPARLDSCEFAILKNWVDAGALDN